jgi:hypothetical protein
MKSERKGNWLWPDRFAASDSLPYPKALLHCANSLSQYLSGSVSPKKATHYSESKSLQHG